MGTKDKGANKDKKGSDRFIIKGKAFWAHVQEVNKLSNKFQLDLSVDKQTAAQLEDLGIEIKNNEKDRDKPDNDRGDYVTLKSEYPPQMVDAKKQKISGKTLVGNGSTVNVATHVYDWKFGKDSGTSLGLDAVQVIDLVEYKDALSDMFEETEGFTSLSSEDDSEEEDNDSGAAEAGRTPAVTKDNPF